MMLRSVSQKIVLLFFLLLGGCSQTVFANEPSFAEQKDVQAFINHMVEKHDFNHEELVALFNTVSIRAEIIQKMIKPLEIESWRVYQLLFVSEWRIAHGVAFWNQYQDALNRAEKEYGVPASIIVATIGIETRYGEKVGDYRVIDSLSNLAFSTSPRAGFFKKELEEFLTLTRTQHLDPYKVTGSYAGAIGQPQFMPSSYHYYAVNFSNSGTIDLIHDEVDVIGSVANYYYRHGWAEGQPIAMPLKEPLPTLSPTMKLIQLDNQFSKEYWIGFPNFRVIKRYNASDQYAMAVYQLSERITESRNRLRADEKS